MTREEANAAIAEKLKAANALIREAELIADEHKLGFSFSGPSYGMGGYYEGDPDDRSRYAQDGWSASSQSC